MRLGCCSGIKKLIVYWFITQFFYSSSIAIANPAVALVARPVLTRVFSQIVSRRVALTAANDAVFARATALQTFKAVGRIAANDAKFAVGATSTLRHAKDISWVSLALSSGMIQLSDLNINENNNIGIVFEPTAVKLTDGRYAIQVNGETKIVNGQASKSDPIIYRYSKEKAQISEYSTDIYKSDILNNHYKYFDTLRTGEYVQSNSIEKLSEYIAQEEYGGKGEEIYEEAEINDKKYRYLSSKVDVQNTYLRHQQIGDNIYPEVRQTFTSKELKFGFDPIIEGFTENARIYSFNEPTENDYLVSTRVTSINYITLEENENFIGDFPQPKVEEQQLGSIADIDSGLFSIRPLTAQQLANLYNALMLSAVSQADYQGLPFNSTNPITATEVQTILSSLGLAPTYSDLFEKAGVGDQIEIDLDLDTIPSSDTDTNIDSSHDYEEFEEPSYPELDMPSARDILNPFKQFFPQLQNFQLRVQSATCPTWSFDLWNKHFLIDSHCGLLEEQRQPIQIIFSVVWAFIALRHLLTA